MAENQIANFEKLSTSQIMEMIGQEGGQTGAGLPRLTINRQPEDDGGNKLPVALPVITVWSSHLTSSLGAYIVLVLLEKNFK